MIRRLQGDEASDCERIMRGLPDWFGIPSAIDEYRKALDRLDTYVAVKDGRVAGFLALKQLTPASAEIHVMAVDQKYHRLGLGRALVEEAERWASRRSLEYLAVKTLGPSRDDPYYAQTRKFYRAVGFVPLEETNLWGDANPCLIMVKHLRCHRDRVAVNRRSVNPRNVFDSLQYGFSQAVVVRGGERVLLSGQVGVDPRERTVGTTLVEQARAAFDNIEHLLGGIGGRLSDVVSLRIYIVETERDHQAAIAAQLRERFPENPPVSTWLFVSALSEPEWLVEIEAEAVLSRCRLSGSG